MNWIESWTGTVHWGLLSHTHTHTHLLKITFAVTGQLIVQLCMIMKMPFCWYQAETLLQDGKCIIPFIGLYFQFGPFLVRRTYLWCKKIKCRGNRMYWIVTLLLQIADATLCAVKPLSVKWSLTLSCSTKWGVNSNKAPVRVGLTASVGCSDDWNQEDKHNSECRFCSATAACCEDTIFTVLFQNCREDRGTKICLYIL